MNTKLLNRVFAVGLIATAVGCGAGSAGPDEGVGNASSALIGGRPASPGEYPSAVALLFQSNYVRCTMSKVGPRHFLVEAPCLYDATKANLSPDFSVGASMHISNAKTLTGAPTHVLTIQKANIHPEWQSCIPNCDTGRVPGLAVIVVDRDTPDIAQATIDLSPVEYGSPVIKAGYGAEAMDGGSNPTQGGRLKIGTARTESGTIVATGAEDIAVNVLVEALELNPQAGTTVGADLGGPLYRAGSNQQLVVGVSSGISLFIKDPSLGATDFYYRLDTSARSPVATWLSSLGVNVVRSVPSPSPYKGQPVAIPGTIQAEDYDFGGPEVAYHDATPQNFPSGAYRVDGVDIDPTGDQGGGYNIGGALAGEWLRYSVTATAGTYDVDVRAASPVGARTLHVEIDGKDVTGAIAIGNTGGWQQYQTFTKQNVRVEQGAHVVRLLFDTDGYNINWLRIGPHVPTCTDGIQNLSESDIDCGGTCPACGAGKRCAQNANCASGMCVNGTCRGAPADAGTIDAGTMDAGGTAGSTGSGGAAGGATGSTSTGAGGSSSTSTSGPITTTTGDTGMGGSSPDDAHPPVVGCGCRTPGSNRASTPAALIALLGAAWFIRIADRRSRSCQKGR